MLVSTNNRNTIHHYLLKYGIFLVFLNGALRRSSFGLSKMHVRDKRRKTHQVKGPLLNLYLAQVRSLGKDLIHEKVLQLVYTDLNNFRSKSVRVTWNVRTSYSWECQPLATAVTMKATPHTKGVSSSSSGLIYSQVPVYILRLSRATRFGKYTVEESQRAGNGIVRNIWYCRVKQQTLYINLLLHRHHHHHYYYAALSSHIGPHTN